MRSSQSAVSEQFRDGCSIAIPSSGSMKETYNVHAEVAAYTMKHGRPMTDGGCI